MKASDDVRGFRVGTYRRSLRRVPAVEVGVTRKTMQAEYHLVSTDECRFWTRFPWVFARGERPAGYKGVVGDTGIFFKPYGVAKWARGEFVAEGYYSRWSVLLWASVSLFFLLVGADGAWRSYHLGNTMQVALSLAFSAAPFGTGVYWWDRESGLFRAIAEEVANDIERGNDRDAEQGDEADEAR